ncbi:zinc finger domain-containing protein [Ophiocordyceps camponoti-floridani]|uniref:Zinc finger domain-containing protein n=1 Tax=Ophiocordyceps camponoti-floridani TaxID=2030778 RepID=A0A8H4VFN5_9HYPO|nr:zinc finger domain-containing protein [Ophiocordyceps camponoti-floridani]
MVRRNSVGELGFFDLEAEESRDSDSNSSGSDSDSNDVSSSSSEPAFSCFTQFPPELRARVWEMFCSDLEVKARVLPFMVMQNTRYTGNLVASPNVIDQTRPLRCLMAVHHESRGLAKVVFPHTLRFKADYDGKVDASMVFNQRTDLILLETPLFRMDCSVPALQTETIWNLAFSIRIFADDESIARGISRLFRNFPNLKRLFHQIDEAAIRTRNIQWVVSERAHQVLVETFEEKPGTSNRSCPSRFRVSPRNVALNSCPWDEPHLENHGHYSSEDSSADDDSDESTGTDLDEYESEGIDDSDLNDDDEEEDSIDAGAVPVQGEHLEDSDEDGPVQADRDPSEARFSSPELDEEQSLKQSERGSFKRKIVIDSDDDDDGDDDHDDHETRVKRPRLARRIVCDSGDDDDDESVGDGQPSRIRAAPSDVEPSDGRSEQQTSGSSSDDGDSVEEEDPQDDDEGDGSDEDDLIDDAISEDSAGSSHEEDE